MRGKTIPQRLKATCPLPGLEGRTVGDFWAWAYSDVLSNSNRGVYAEYLVGSALDVVGTGVRTEWDDVDLRYCGHGIEVKASGYVQTWAQTRPSTIQFGIQRSRSLISGTNQYEDVPARSAGCYVFYLFTERDREKARSTGCWMRTHGSSTWWRQKPWTESWEISRV